MIFLGMILVSQELGLRDEPKPLRGWLWLFVSLHDFGAEIKLVSPAAEFVREFASLFRSEMARDRFEIGLHRDPDFDDLLVHNARRVKGLMGHPLSV